MEDPWIVRARNICGISVHVTSADHPCMEHPRMFRVRSKRRVTRMSVKLSAADKDVPRRKSFGVPTDHPLFGGMQLPYLTSFPRIVFGFILKY